MTDKEKEARMVFAQLATLGLTLFGIYEFAPFFVEGHLSGLGKGAEGVGKVIGQIPWVPIAAIASVVPYAVLVSRVIPRRVKLEHRPKAVERIRRKDTLG